MKTILSVGACWFLFVFINVEAVTDGDFQSLLARLYALEEKQAFSEQRIAALETENMLSQKRIADLEKYKTFSERRVAALERKNRRNDAHAIVMKMYAQKVALENDKILSDKATTKGFDNTLSDELFSLLDKGKILPSKKISSVENEYAVTPNRRVNDDRNTAAETTNRPNAGNVASFVF
ncbi:hypothetical protein DPMN_065839 [Dreissena polymorpha]|uniref:Uncharacterized protein n=1 Tax=Dreissena polymorpha TaxID=45954 RepID=A0A9D3YSX1_DREPO|nr:hypothetical protein DPMN_065839 [Dreissena polymorpha]